MHNNLRHIKKSNRSYNCNRMHKETWFSKFNCYNNSIGTSLFRIHNKCSRWVHKFNRWFNSWISSNRMKKIPEQMGKKRLTGNRFRIIQTRCSNCICNFSSRFNKIYNNSKQFSSRLIMARNQAWWLKTKMWLLCLQWRCLEVQERIPIVKLPI